MPLPILRVPDVRPSVLAAAAVEKLARKGFPRRPTQLVYFNLATMKRLCRETPELDALNRVQREFEHLLAMSSLGVQI